MLKSGVSRETGSRQVGLVTGPGRHLRQTRAAAHRIGGPGGRAAGRAAVGSARTSQRWQRHASRRFFWFFFARLSLKRLLWLGSCSPPRAVLLVFLAGASLAGDDDLLDMSELVSPRKTRRHGAS